MKTNVTIELTDVERQLLASFIAGKPVARFATRQDIRELCQGLIAGIVDSRRTSDLSQPAPASKHEAFIEQTIRERGYNEAQAKSYRRGWTMKPFVR